VRTQGKSLPHLLLPWSQRYEKPWLGRAILPSAAVPFPQLTVQTLPQQEKPAWLSVALEPLAEAKFVGIGKFPAVCHPEQQLALPMAHHSPVHNSFRIRS